ncbi:MAG: AAA family ATPase [Bacilli bacterium]|nr:AAA family ATPase [Bacilli bacterium]
MYLKKIVAKGFKSFADNIVFNFDRGINGIVGPNGSGKSNVVDAIRWVLGEQSVKSLRGEGNMTDVIFSGSKSRRSMNMASVAITFDNSDKYFPLEYDEIEIKRRVYKDGSNEYFINGEKVRLKDVTNLLLDSGIAKESFNIISQGQIEAIIMSKPENRRVIFEEASGVLKYKRRKLEAIKKLEKTHDNKNRINDIINEIEDRIEPLKLETQKALEYEDAKDKLENLDIALITEDITSLNYKYNDSKERLEKLNREVASMMSSTSSNEAKIEKYKVNIAEIDDKINNMQEKVIELTEKSENLNSRRIVISERRKYEVDDARVHDNIVLLKEKELTLSNEIDSLNEEIKYLKVQIDDIDEKLAKERDNLNNIKKDKLTVQSKLTEMVRENQNLDIKIESLKENIENGGPLPFAVKSVLSNPHLPGIHNAVGSLIEIDEEYSLAILVALGNVVNNVVTDDEDCAKKAIKYLKNVGRATFLPLNIIKSKYIDNSILSVISSTKGFINIASNLVKCENKYKNIIEYALGNIIVTDDIDSAVNIGKKIKNRYKIVTLDGQIINAGGSMTGGKNKKPRNIISDKYDLENNLKMKEKILREIAEYENKVNELDYSISVFEDKIYLLDKDRLLKNDDIDNKRKSASEKAKEKIKIVQDIKSTENLLNGVLSKEEEEIIEKYYSSLKKKDEANKKLKSLIRQKDDLNSSLEEYEISLKKENSLYSSKTGELKDLEIEVNRLDVKLDNLLSNLTESYSMTYDKARENYKLEINYDEAKREVNSLKRKIKEIGIVNLTAPEEYKKVSERYEFLSNQIRDLNDAENTLLEIIDDMDKVMIKQFKERFDIINSYFKETFKEMFNGGNAELKLTDPNNLLETGVDITCSPPGKRLKNISLLSGGEKTLTAISLLFAIIKSKTSPFCVLDEVEAALDEANVDIFGKYLVKLKEKSQFIVITHKKKTMEYANILYGITMQESGISKLVSVKLEDIE